MIFLLELRNFNKLPFAMDHQASPCSQDTEDWRGSHNPEAVVMGTFLEYLKINYS